MDIKSIMKVADLKTAKHRPVLIDNPFSNDSQQTHILRLAKKKRSKPIKVFKVLILLRFHHFNNMKPIKEPFLKLPIERIGMKKKVKTVYCGSVI